MSFDLEKCLLATLMAATLVSCSGDQAETADEQEEMNSGSNDLVPAPIQAPSPIELEETGNDGDLDETTAAVDNTSDDTTLESGSPSPEPVPPVASRSSVGPTYSCDGQLTNVERMVCDDSGLAGLEREMVARYNARRDASPASERDRYLSDQRRFLRQLRGCQTRACISSAYRPRIGELSQKTRAQDVKNIHRNCDLGRGGCELISLIRKSAA